MADDVDIAAIRQELSTVESVHAATELAVLVRLGGTWRRRGTPAGAVTEVRVATTSGAVVRRIVALATALGLPRPEVAMRAAAGLRRSTQWSATMPAVLLVPLGVVTDSGGPVAGLPDVPNAPDAPNVSDASDAPDVSDRGTGPGGDGGPVLGAVVRGALLASGSVSHPRRPAHLEIRLPSVPATLDLAELLAQHGLAVHADEQRCRVVAKSRSVVVDLLEVAGATRAAQAHRRHHDRRQLRNRATRLANADAANVERSVDAARDQVTTVKELVEAVGWDALPEELRDVGLARLVNPSASLAELGELTDPPLAKSTVHRRLARLATLARRQAETGSLHPPDHDAGH